MVPENFKMFVQKLSWCVYALFVLCTLSVLSFLEASANDLDAELEAQSNSDRDSLPDQKAHSRQKRFVYFNTQSPVDIGKFLAFFLLARVL